MMFNMSKVFFFFFFFPTAIINLYEKTDELEKKTQKWHSEINKELSNTFLSSWCNRKKKLKYFFTGT